MDEDDDDLDNDDNDPDHNYDNTGLDIFSYIKFDGKRVEDGFLDARKSGDTLIGIDEALRYFIHQENPEFQSFEFEIPVRIRKGSWEALFSESLDMLLIKGALTWGGAKYLGKALEKMAESDFKNAGFKEIFKRSFKAMTWVIRMAIHLETLSTKKFRNVEFSEDNQLTKLKNNEGRELWVPTEYLELFANCPDSMFSKIAKIIEDERELVVGYNEESKTEEVRVSHSQKFIFTPEQIEEDELFPELKHNEYVELQGHVTRGNEKSNTIGFLYQEHILTCYPDEGNIKRYRNALFSNCLMKGFVDREDKKGNINELRPRILFIALELLNPEQTELFNE